MPIKTWVTDDTPLDESPENLKGVAVGGGVGNSARYFVAGYDGPVWDWMLDPIRPPGQPAIHTWNIYDRATHAELLETFTAHKLKLLQCARQ